MFPAEDIQEMQKLFEEAKKDEKKKPKKQGEDEEVFKFGKTSLSFIIIKIKLKYFLST